MITAITTGADGRRYVILGVTSENLKRLTEGQPLFLRAESHAGFPTDLAVAIFFGETERALTDAMKPFINDHTKVITVPREDTKGKPS
jgi:hypothetical protein